MIIDQGKIVAEGTPESLRDAGDGSLTDLFRKLTTSDVAA
jgi:ABC-type multidrug transport system fused ATPase/permease subunit